MIIIGDALEELRRLPADHYDCVVTSPPYFGLRDYGVEGQLGLEPTMQEHIENMVSVCAEIHRVLKPSGTFWLNYGDCYAGYHGNKNAEMPTSATNGWTNGTNENKRHSAIGGKIKPKDLCMIPNRLAIAMQEWGWWVRSEIIWAKPNPMPESVTDRPATAHEKIWLLTKSARYFYDNEAVREPVSLASLERWPGGTGRINTSEKRDRAGFGANSAGVDLAGRNLRNYEPAPVQVWEMATRPFPGAHFATFPPELVERCLQAGCPKGGKVLDPFGGAGTVGLIADSLNIDWTLIELNPEYAAMAQARIKSRVAGKGRKEMCPDTGSLFNVTI